MISLILSQIESKLQRTQGLRNVVKCNETSLGVPLRWFMLRMWLHTESTRWNVRTHVERAYHTCEDVVSFVIITYKVNSSKGPHSQVPRMNTRSNASFRRAQTLPSDAFNRFLPTRSRHALEAVTLIVFHRHNNISVSLLFSAAQWLIFLQVPQ